MHGRLVVSARNITFGSGHNRNPSDIEFGASTVQYRLQAVAVRKLLHVKLYLCVET
jgi:hypothetical protein